MLFYSPYGWLCVQCTSAIFLWKLISDFLHPAASQSLFAIPLPPGCITTVEVRTLAHAVQQPKALLTNSSKILYWCWDELAAYFARSQPYWKPVARLKTIYVVWSNHQTSRNCLLEFFLFRKQQMSTNIPSFACLSTFCSCNLLDWLGSTFCLIQ